MKKQSISIALFEQKKLRENLLKYCELDTWAMVRILEELRKEAG